MCWGTGSHERNLPPQVSRLSSRGKGYRVVGSLRNEIHHDLATTESCSKNRNKVRPKRHVFPPMVWTSLDLKKVKEMLGSKLLNTRLAFPAHISL